MKIYLSGIITGREFAELFEDWSSKKNFLEKIGYEVLYPLAGKSYLKSKEGKASATENNPSYEKHPVSKDKSIFNRDRWMVQSCDLLLCDLTNATKVSIGCMFELAWASYLHKHVILVMDQNKIHEHAFVTESSNIIFNSLEEAFEYLKSLMED